MIKNADDLFDLNRSRIPDPNNPKPGDTYENVVDYGMFKLTQRIVVSYVNEHDTYYYINGEQKSSSYFAYYIRSMKNIKVVLEV